MLALRAAYCYLAGNLVRLSTSNNLKSAHQFQIPQSDASPKQIFEMEIAMHDAI